MIDHEPLTEDPSCTLVGPPVIDTGACMGAGRPGDGTSYYYLVCRITLIAWHASDLSRLRNRVGLAWLLSESGAVSARSPAIR